MGYVHEAIGSGTVLNLVVVPVIKSGPTVS
jgi:hypothetical protein